MYYVSAQGVDKRMINVHYYYYSCHPFSISAVSVVDCRQGPGVGDARSAGEREGQQRKRMQHQYPEDLA